MQYYKVFVLSFDSVFQNEFTKWRFHFLHCLSLCPISQLCTHMHNVPGGTGKSGSERKKTRSTLGTAEYGWEWNTQCRVTLRSAEWEAASLPMITWQTGVTQLRQWPRKEEPRLLWTFSQAEHQPAFSQTVRSLVFLKWGLCKCHCIPKNGKIVSLFSWKLPLQSGASYRLHVLGSFDTKKQIFIIW